MIHVENIIYQRRVINTVRRYDENILKFKPLISKNSPPAKYLDETRINNVIEAWDDPDKTLPLISVDQLNTSIGTKYTVRDGNHRLAIYLLRGFERIPVHIL